MHRYSTLILSHRAATCPALGRTSCFGRFVLPCPALGHLSCPVLLCPAFVLLWDIFPNFYLICPPKILKIEHQSHRNDICLKNPQISKKNKTKGIKHHEGSIQFAPILYKPLTELKICLFIYLAPYALKTDKKAKCLSTDIPTFAFQCNWHLPCSGKNRTCSLKNLDSGSSAN